MQTIHLYDPAWGTTFPHPVMPHHDEWLPGLLLRCDEDNHWGSRTTLAHLLHPGPERFHRCWRTKTPNLIVIAHGSLNLDYLAQLLAVPTSALLATTYQAELARIYDTARPLPGHLNPSFSFHVCPVCLAETRLLRRILTLPHITFCPQHHITLVETCQCGTALQLFNWQTHPFTCHACGLDWANLPRIKTSAERIASEQKLLSWYELFFSRGTPPMMRHALQLIDKSSLVPPLSTSHSAWKQLSLGDLVASLVKRGRSPQDLLNWMELVSRLRTMSSTQFGEHQSKGK